MVIGHRQGRRTLAGVTLAAWLLAGTAPAFGAEGMRTLRGEAELKALLKRADAYQTTINQGVPPQPPVPPPAPPPPVAVSADAAAPAPAAAESITNVQTAGVDEGGIVKVHGKHLVVLRRGRLFTVAVGDESLTPIDMINAFPPEHDGGRAWYDEMLITGDTVLVMGYTYARQGTELNRFRIDAAGKLTYVDTHYLRSGDYYSSDNYASRLIGSKLVFYAPNYINRDKPLQNLPALRRWSEGREKSRFEPAASVNRIYLPDLLVNNPAFNVSAFHSVTMCDLAAVRLSCDSTVVMGSYGRTFYVGQDGVYVWTGNLFQRPWNDRRKPDQRGIVYRIPFDGKRPSAAVVWGGPSDQFGLRSEPDGTLHALVRPEYGGDAMWLNKIVGGGQLALLKLPSSRFGSGGGAPRKADYRPLPGGDMSGIKNRYVGNHLLYGATYYSGSYANGRYTPYTGPRPVYAVPLDGGMIARLDTDMSLSRIDQMGKDAILVGNPVSADGNGGSLRFQAVALDGRGSAVVDSYDLPGAREGESRSQAYFFRADNTDGTDGTLGLPVGLPMRPGSYGYGSGIFFMARKDRKFAPLGTLDSGLLKSIDDGCVASCVDWYGNARPIFLRGRIFALLGYELVEGRISEGRIAEVRRTSFMPDKAAPGR
ncbi:beta-propeller domain-containing protein [Novosphingobium sp. TH158]|uniref:beta-propeller domain-containing protein n=1 Tax=Novosphingobium sp. TH158 TaxID=2067455 RepID=UPI0013040D68|nr:beta-propeller domain-containing protein [Novosphingobium sp. TH158]